MVCRIHIFGSIVVIFVLQSTVVSEGRLSSTEDISSGNSTLPHIFQSSPNTEVPSIFPSSEIGNKPIISLNKTVDIPNLSEIRKNKSNRNPVEDENIKVDANGRIEPIKTNSTILTDFHTDSIHMKNSEIPTTEKLHKEVGNNFSRQIDTEVEDLLENPKETYIVGEPEATKVKYAPDQDVNLSVFLIDKLLQTEDSLRNISHQNKLESDGIIQGKLAAILAGVFLVVSILGYITLLSWRRFLEHRYGNREMLVNEEDFYTGDLGHFTI